MTAVEGLASDDVERLIERLRELADFSHAARGLHRRGVHPNNAERAFTQAADALATLSRSQPAPTARSTPEQQAKAIAAGYALDGEDGGYPAPTGSKEVVEALRAHGFIQDNDVGAAVECLAALSTVSEQGSGR